ncbi:hypothetical protein L7F22_041810 [Adiantum nelumboides]|nr:hypothetical protein [Adiantum nelumboides]
MVVDSTWYHLTRTTYGQVDAAVASTVAVLLRWFGMRLQSTPPTHGLPAVDSPTPILLLILLYLAFEAGGLVWIRTCGLAPPRRKEEAAPLRALVLLHNAFCLSLSLYMALGLSFSAYQLGCVSCSACLRLRLRFRFLSIYFLRMRYSMWGNAYNEKEALMAHFVYIFYMSKIVEFMDTASPLVIMVLKHNVRQITLLHVYHHTSVAFIWWMISHHAPGGDGEEHKNDLKKSGHFHTHYLRSKVINGAGDSIVETVNVKEPNIKLTPPPPIAPLASHSLSVQLTDDRTKEGKLRALIEDVKCKLTVAKDEHATCLKKLEAGKVQQLSDEKFGKALSLLDEQISATKLKLASVAEDDPIKRIQLEAQESM